MALAMLCAAFLSALSLSTRPGPCNPLKEKVCILGPDDPEYGADGDVIYRINTGGALLTDPSFNIWAADEHFASGVQLYFPYEPIANTNNDGLYFSERSAINDSAAFSYLLPIADGTYLVRLHFAEVYWVYPGQRIFDVEAEGIPVVKNLDIVAAVGPRAAMTRSFYITVTDGILNLRFPPADVNRPKISGIEVFEYNSVIPTDTPTYTATYTPSNTPTPSITPTPTLSPTPTVLPTYAQADATPESVSLLTDPIPKMSWMLPLTGTQHEPVVAEWHHLEVSNLEGEVVLDDWLPHDKICQDFACEVSISDDLLDVPLANGQYTWRTQFYLDGDTSEWRASSPLYVAMPPPTAPQNPDMIHTETGRVRLRFGNDPNTFWYHVFVKSGDDILSDQWYRKTAEVCDDFTCDLLLEAHPVNGDYTIEIETWGPGGYSGGDARSLVGPFEFTLDLEAPVAPVRLEPYDPGESLRFVWFPSANATWYNLWVGPQDLSSTYYSEWLSSTELGCELQGLCSTKLDGPLPPSTQPSIWYVRAWGPGGPSTGGLYDSGWLQGMTFTASD